MRTAPKAKKGAESSQPEVPSTLRRAKIILFMYNNKCTALPQNPMCLERPWEILATVGSIPRPLESAETVACFRLANGHNFLGVRIRALA
ncbi:hypothetical protein TNCV_302891 [Trichonephila clavipes]|nr:hypothetical protein TNCV_302891 [Trichonephila clavipes]